MCEGVLSCRKRVRGLFRLNLEGYILSNSRDALCVVLGNFVRKLTG